jgi:hypothetical protein
VQSVVRRSFISWEVPGRVRCSSPAWQRTESGPLGDRHGPRVRAGYHHGLLATTLPRSLGIDVHWMSMACSWLSIGGMERSR